VETPTHNAVEETRTPSATILETKIDDTPTPPDPTATKAPLAASVNGEGILLEDYQVEAALYEAASGTSLATDGTNIVLQDLIDQTLLAQGARALGFEVDEMMIQKRIDELGLTEEELTIWKVENGYSEDGFIRAMKRAVASAWMRDQITKEVPRTAEQIHARQILLYNLPEAETAYALLEEGSDFEALAAEYDPVTKGELGWFPRGYLTVPELEDFIFALEPGEISSIIQTPLGFHIVQVIEREEDHPLSVNAYQVVQLQWFARWLEDQREESEILVFIE
jgi:peptidyl-prolyl cis-trans isomerase C